MTPRPPTDLEVATRAIRGMMRYKNTAMVQVVAMLLRGIDTATAVMEVDNLTLDRMVLVDPELETAWQDRRIERGLTISELRAMADLVRSATAIAKQELTQEQGTSERQGSNQSNQG